VGPVRAGINVRVDLHAGQTVLLWQPAECDALPPTGLATSQQHAELTEVHGLPGCSLSKLRAVRGVALLGGVLQVLLTMVLAGGVASAIGASIHEGVFIGALVRPSNPLKRSMTAFLGSCTTRCHCFAAVLQPVHPQSNF
jgi:hypothetical protein